MMDDCHAEATRLLTENLDKLTLIAETLKEREVIQADEFIALMEGRSLDELDRQKEEVLQEQKGVEKTDAEAEHNEAAAEETPAQEEIMQAETAAEDVITAPVMEADDAEQKSTELVTEKQDEVK